MSNHDRLIWSKLLAIIVTTPLSIIAMVLSLYGSWRWVAGVAVLCCMVYQIRIWLIQPLVK
jgi:hypothetical protein